jgi:hypothetical protein
MSLHTTTATAAANAAATAASKRGGVPSVAAVNSDNDNSTSAATRKSQKATRHLDKGDERDGAVALIRFSQPAARNPSRPANTSMPLQQQQQLAVFLGEVGCAKYMGTFQREEMDMEAVMHATDEDLKELGIPKGPRIKILRKTTQAC